MYTIFTQTFWREWYRRPCGVREALVLAIPIMLSMCSASIMTLTDRLCLSWYSLFEMNAAFQAGCLYWTLIVFPTGICNFVNTFVAQYNGANEKEKIGVFVWQGVFIGFIFGLLLFALTPAISPLFIACGVDEATSILAQKYWFYVTMGAGASIALESFVSFFNGIYKTKIVMWTTLLGFAINVVLDPVLIFGVGGHLRLGIAGAAIATSIALWVKFFVFLTYFLKESKDDVYGIRKGFRASWSTVKRLLGLGSMSGFQMTIEHVFYLMLVLVMARFGTAASASTAIAYNLNGFLYMPAIGLALATAALVGNQIGANKPELAIRAIKTTTTLGLGFSCLLGLIFIIAPQPFVDLYALGNKEGFDAIRPLAINIIRIVGIYLVADTTNLIFSAALRGAGDARFIMLSTSSVVALTLVALFGGVRWLNLGVYWCWWVMTGYLVVNSVVFVLRIRQGKWRKRQLLAAAQ